MHASANAEDLAVCLSQVVGVTKEERVEIKLREIKGLLVAMMQCGRLKVPEEQRQHHAVNGDLSKARRPKAMPVPCL